MVLRAENVELLKQYGKIFFLREKKQTLLTRLQGDKERPLLQGEESLEDKIDRLLSTREAIYVKVADYIVDVDEKSPDKIADEILVRIAKK